MIRLEMVRMAWNALVANKFRTVLSMLGIIIGVSTVIAVIGIGSGAQRQIEEQFKNLSVTSLVVFPSRGGSSSSKLSVEDLQTVLLESQFVVDGTASISGNETISFRNENTSTSVQGVTPHFFDVSNLKLGWGENFTEEDDVSRAKVVVLGYTLAETLFTDPQLAVGEEVSIARRKCTVVGVLAENGASSFGTSFDDAMYIPFSTAQKTILGSKAQVRLVFLGRDVDSLAFAETEITDILRAKHRIREGRDDDFRVRDPGSMVASAKESTSTMSFLLTAVATIVLIVSGIGIMNVMFVTVAERTKEIGVLKAIGAKQRDILEQFLLESVILSVIGGFLGIVLGQITIPLLKDYGAVYSFSAVLLGFCFSVLVGVFFGFYPAYKASRLDPVDALRSE